MPVKKHGHCANYSRTRTYRSWSAMHQRCTKPSRAEYKYYGGRGIAVCQRWDDYGLFLCDMGERPAGTSLDRINNDGNYEPSNCRWATARDQIRNSRSVHVLELGGRSMLVGDWERHLGLSQGCIHHRIRSGWPLERCLTTPSLQKGKASG